MLKLMSSGLLGRWTHEEESVCLRYVFAIRCNLRGNRGMDLVIFAFIQWSDDV